MPVAEALVFMRSQVNTVREAERVPLPQALDRILAEPAIAAVSVPPQDNSAMDGYALRAQDTSARQPLAVIGTALAGHMSGSEVVAGTCVRIMTGGAIPAGADCVVMQENTEVHGDTIIVTQAARRGENIRRSGEDILAGTEVIAAGRRLGPVDIALLASLGIAEVSVFRRLRVAVLSTGDELIAPGHPLSPGQIYDSNRYGIVALLQRLAVDVIDLGLLPDQPAAIASAFERVARDADAIISSGGVSVGDADFVKDIMAQLGQINFWKVAIKPGKPFAFGTLGQSWFFGLPGNPVSAMVTLHQLTVPILRQMAGEQVEQPLMIRAKAASTFNKRPGRTDYQRSRLAVDNGAVTVRRTGNQGSGVLTSFSDANCYAVLEQDRDRVSEGEEVDILPFDRFLI